METNREERRQQRLRGAQSHQVADVDFAFSIPVPAPAAAPQITRTDVTPQPETDPQEPVRQIPRPGRSRSSSAQKRPAPATPVANANTSAKRQRIDEGLSSVRSTRSSRNATRQDLYQIQEDVVPPQNDESYQREEKDELDGEDQDISIVSSRQSRRRPSSSAVNEEVAESPRSAPGSGRRTASTTAEMFSAKLQSMVETPLKAPVVQSSPSRGRHLKRTADRTPRVQSDDAEELDELSPDQPTRQNRQSLVGEAQYSEVEEEQEEEVAEEIPDVEAAKKIGRKRRRAATPEVEAEVQEVSEQPTPLPARSQPKSRAKPQQPKKSRPKGSPAIQRNPKPSHRATKGSSKDVIPITVHRLTKPIPYNGSDDEADVLASDIPFKSRGGVNVVDVLSQVCEEVINSGIENLEEGGAGAEDAAVRREYRTKLRAVEAFQEEMRTRLLELTINLDTNYALTKRLKIAQKEKLGLRGELLRLRAEREQVAIKMDEVRIKHEKAGKESEQLTALSTSLHDIELAVNMAREHTSSSGQETLRSDLLAQVRNVANTAGSTSEEGGLLKKLREFNGFLERAAGALEGR